jgi:hypothetical protein
MENMNRRSALALGLSASTVPLLALATPAAAAMSAADAGKEIMPGVRQVELGEWPVAIATYKKAVMNDYIVAPGSGFPVDTMKNDMVCIIMEGKFDVKQDGKPFTADTGHVFTCATGQTEEDTNPGDVAAVMRVIDLMAT